LLSHSSRRSLAIALTVVAAGWMGLIFYLSSLSGDDTSRIFDADAIYWLGGGLSYTVHVLLYSVLAALIQCALWGWNRGPSARWVISVVTFSLLYAITDEYHQSFVGGRAATVTDVFVDTLAAAAAAGALWVVITPEPRSKPV
jgi:hypothetical protein